MTLKRLVESITQQYRKEAKEFLQKKFPKHEIILDNRAFKTQKTFDQGKYIIHIYAAETASGKDAIAFDIEHK